MTKRSILFAVFFTLLSSLAFAAPTECPKHYLNGEAPEFLNEKLSSRSKEVCYKGFALIHSGVTRTPLAVAEHVTREHLRLPRPDRSDDTFRADPNIPASDRAELNDYRGSGFDRGHMAPSGDMFDEQSQSESFSLANMVPQNPDNNRNLWEAIESAVRDLAKRTGELFVVTGPIFFGSDLKSLKGRVLVPTHIYKAVYDPARKEAAAYLVRNDPGDRYVQISIAELEKVTGLSVFPKLPEDVKQKELDLPKPRVRRKEAVEDPALLPVR